MSAYVRKMALDGICIRLDLKDVRQLTVILWQCSDNLNTVWTGGTDIERRLPSAIGYGIIFWYRPANQL